MTSKEIIETLQETHPGLSVLQIVKLLNRASNDFCRRSECVEGSFYMTLDIDAAPGGQRYYDLPAGIIRIFDVDVADETAPQLIGRPDKRDIT